MSEISRDSEYQQIHASIARLFQSRERVFQFFIVVNGILLSVVANTEASFGLSAPLTIFGIIFGVISLLMEMRYIKIIDRYVAFGMQFERENGATLIQTVWKTPGPRVRHLYNCLYGIIILLWGAILIQQLTSAISG